MKHEPAFDAKLVTLSVAAVQSLVDEIGRLKARVGQLEADVRAVEKLAYLDPLTGLPNRRGLFRELENVIDRLNRYGGSAAIIFVDTDDLKQINDRFGHPTGDAALITIAQILVETVRSSDIVARLAGDEFIVLLADMDELGAWNMALRIVEAVDTTPIINNHRVPLSVAVGVSAVNASDQPLDAISRADQAMYGIKATSLPRFPEKAIANFRRN